MAPSSVRLSRHGQGDLGARDWGKEGDGLYASARHLWASAIVKSRRFERLRDPRSIKKNLNRYVVVNSGFPKASILLIGYCVEMYLKGGLTKQLIGCADDVFRSTLKTYSHGLDKLAKDLIEDLSKQQLQDLRALSNFVLNDARYPVEASNNQEYVDKINSRSRSINNGLAFRRYCLLAKHIRTTIGRIDGDSSNPCSSSSWDVDSDGYLCYRYGGNLPPRITYRRCSVSSRLGPVTYQEVVDLVENSEIVLPGPIDDYQIYSDQDKKGKRVLKRLLKE
ncbi:hypothetical protein JJD61_24085 [Pseudomonas carnis]|uniref:hypothetical protein n=1 Tax=Pseudomonas carnis TaxID=2487355 RepID=UPI00190BEA4D|nr:hypothetical protein [Pseudomonas carnis]MBK3473788.1 hypothetical protein [Pseudomonas carnis]